MFGRFKMGLSPVLGDAGLAAYQANVLALSPIGYWPLNETSGTNADNAQGNADRDGTYSGVVLNSTASPITGDNAPLWDGSNDHLNIYSASLDGAFNGQEGTLSLWAKVSAAGVWSDTTSRYLIRIAVSGTNQLLILKSTTTNQLTFTYTAGATTETINDTSLAGTTAWFNVIITWSLSNDRMRAYINGSQVGTDQTGLGTWSGSLASNAVVIGAVNTTPSSVWSGYESHAAIFSDEKTGADITTLATAV